MKLIFWNVDTQIDFIDSTGKLYVQGAETIIPALGELTEIAKAKSIFVVNTADYHQLSSAELSVNPDYQNTFPPHCIAKTPGAEFIPETNPENPFIIDWDKNYNREELETGLKNARNIVIRKDAFDVFKGNKNTESVIEFLAPEMVVIYGVTTNVCVNDAVAGLAERVKRVVVIADAIKELPNLPLPFNQWSQLGVELKSLTDLKNLLNQI